MKAKIIKTEEEYEAAVSRIDELMDAVSGTPEEDELDLLCLLVEHYEEEHYPIGLPSPIAAIEFFMEQNNLTPADMVQYLGSPSKVSEVLSGKRALSKTMIRKLVEGLGIPPEILLEVESSYPLQSAVQRRVAESSAKYGKESGSASVKVGNRSGSSMIVGRDNSGSFVKRRGKKRRTPKK